PTPEDVAEMRARTGASDEHARFINAGFGEYGIEHGFEEIDVLLTYFVLLPAFSCGAHVDEHGFVLHHALKTCAIAGLALLACAAKAVEGEAERVRCGR